MEDSQCSAKEAVVAYNKLTSVDGVKIIPGTSCGGAIGNDYSFDADGEVVGLSRLVAEVLPMAERTAERKYRTLGPAPKE